MMYWTRKLFPDKDVRVQGQYWTYISQLGVIIPDYVHILKDVTVSEMDKNTVLVGDISVQGTTASGSTLSFPLQGINTSEYRVVDGKIVEAWVR